MEYDDECELISMADFINWSLRPLPPTNPSKYTFSQWAKKHRYHLNKIYQNIMKYSHKNGIAEFVKKFNYTQFSYYVYQNSCLDKNSPSSQITIPEFDLYNFFDTI